MKKICLNTLIIGCLFLTGCATSNNATINTTSTEDGYMYNRSNNLEYMDVKNIEKVKRAVSLLIDKVDAQDAKINQKLDKGALDNDLLLMNMMFFIGKNGINFLIKFTLSSQTPLL